MWISNYVNRCIYSLGNVFGVQTNASTPIAQSIDYWRLNLFLIISFNKMHLSTILGIETSAYCFIRRLCVFIHLFFSIFKNAETSKQNDSNEMIELFVGCLWIFVFQEKKITWELQQRLGSADLNAFVRCSDWLRENLRDLAG